MTAKEYLEEIAKFDVCIDQKQQLLDSMKKNRTYIKGIDYSRERVQTTYDPGNQTDKSDEMYDLEREINANIDAFHEMKNERLDLIQLLSDARHIDVLYKCYIDYMSIEQIAVAIGYSYSRTSDFYREGMKKFEAIFNLRNFS